MKKKTASPVRFRVIGSRLKPIKHNDNSIIPISLLFIQLVDYFEAVEGQVGEVFVDVV